MIGARSFEIMLIKVKAYWCGVRSATVSVHFFFYFFVHFVTFFDDTYLRTYLYVCICLLVCDIYEMRSELQ